MNVLELPEEVHSFIERLTATDPKPESIWVIGSRANGRATVASDTDLLVFGSPALVYALSLSKPPSEIDCLVVHDGNNYRDPWQEKEGSLARLDWKIVNPGLGCYVGIKWVADEESEDGSSGNMVHYQERAVRVWSR